MGWPVFLGAAAGVFMGVLYRDWKKRRATRADAEARAAAQARALIEAARRD